jgi:pantothenate kinase type III
MDAWVSGTLARFDAVKAMGDDLTAAMNAGMAAYAQALADTALAIQRLQIEQQEATVPGAAGDAQAAVIKMYQKLAEAYDLMAQAYTTGNTAVLQQGLSAAGEAQGLATAARTALRQVATPCNITVPAG